MTDKGAPAGGDAGASKSFSVGCHPGVPGGDDLEAQQAQFLASPPAAPAARCIRRAFSPGAGGNSRVAKVPHPLLGNIIERQQPSVGVARPPNSGDSRGTISPARATPPSTRSAERPPSLSPGELEEISRENEAYVASLSPEEILAEQEHLSQVLPPRLYQKWSAKER